jgi:hypothetical protein
VLRESEARLRALVHASSDVLYQMNPDWTEMRHLSGGGFLEDAGAPERNWLDRYIPASDQPQVTATIHAAIRTKSVFDLEHRVRMADGTIGWTSSRAVPLYGDTGEAKGWFGAASNITPLRESKSWLAAQKEAFQAAVSGASVEASLAILARAALERMGAPFSLRMTAALSCCTGPVDDVALLAKHCAKANADWPGSLRIRSNCKKSAAYSLRTGLEAAQAAAWHWASYLRFLGAGQAWRQLLQHHA